MPIPNGSIELLRTLAGSRAYNLHDENSDDDHHVVYATPTVKFLEFSDVKLKGHDFDLREGDDVTSVEIKDFLGHVLRGNPTWMETFYAKVVNATDFGLDLLMLAPYVLSRKRVYEATKGYAKNQRVKMFEPPPGTGDPDTRKRKSAIAYLRCLHHGVYLLNEGTMKLWIEDSTLRDFLLRVRHGAYRNAEVIEWAEVLGQELDKAYADSKMREEPDMERVNAFLLRVRREVWQ